LPKGSAALALAALNTEREDLDTQTRAVCEIAKRKEEHVREQQLLDDQREATGLERQQAEAKLKEQAEAKQKELVQQAEAKLKEQLRKEAEMLQEVERVQAERAAAQQVLQEVVVRAPEAALRSPLNKPAADVSRLPSRIDVPGPCCAMDAPHEFGVGQRLRKKTRRCFRCFKCGVLADP